MVKYDFRPNGPRSRHLHPLDASLIIDGQEIARIKWDTVLACGRDRQFAARIVRSLIEAQCGYTPRGIEKIERSFGRTCAQQLILDLQRDDSRNPGELFKRAFDAVWSEVEANIGPLKKEHGFPPRFNLNVELRAAIEDHLYIAYCERPRPVSELRDQLVQIEAASTKLRRLFLAMTPDMQTALNLHSRHGGLRVAEVLSEKARRAISELPYGKSGHPVDEAINMLLLRLIDLYESGTRKKAAIHKAQPRMCEQLASQSKLPKRPDGPFFRFARHVVDLVDEGRSTIETIRTSDSALGRRIEALLKARRLQKDLRSSARKIPPTEPRE